MSPTATPGWGWPPVEAFSSESVTAIAAEEPNEEQSFDARVQARHAALMSEASAVLAAALTLESRTVENVAAAMHRIPEDEFDCLSDDTFALLVNVLSG